MCVSPGAAGDEADATAEEAPQQRRHTTVGDVLAAEVPDLAGDSLGGDEAQAAAPAAAAAANSPTAKDDGAAVVSPRQRPVKQLRDDIEAKIDFDTGSPEKIDFDAGSPQKLNAGSPQRSARSPRELGSSSVEAAVGNPQQSSSNTAEHTAASGSNRSGSGRLAGPSNPQDDSQGLRERFGRASPRLTQAEIWQQEADARQWNSDQQQQAAEQPSGGDGLTTGAAWAAAGGGDDWRHASPAQEITVADAAGASDASASTDEADTVGREGSDTSPHGRLTAAYAHLSTAADAEDHQVQLLIVHLKTQLIANCQVLTPATSH